jgi:hypothetical protein
MICFCFVIEGDGEEEEDDGGGGEDPFFLLPLLPLPPRAPCHNCIYQL